MSLVNEPNFPECGSNQIFSCVSNPPIQCGYQWSYSPDDFFVFAGYPYAGRIAFFSAAVTLRGRSLLDTHASEASISPGVNLGSGTVQKPLDLSILIFRQCCAEAMLAASRHVTAISIFIGVVVTIAKCYSAASGFVRAHTKRSAAAFDD